MLNRIFLKIALLAALIASALSVFAQTNTATLLGTVRDASGAVIPGVTITAINVKTQVVRTTITDDGGNYEVPLLVVGEYSISAELTGFKRAERTGVVLAADQKVKFDFGLQVGEITESVTVNEDAPLVNTQNVERGVVIGSAQVENLPLNSRNFANLITLQPGVVLGGQVGGAITFNGLPFEGSTINIDGTDAANPDWPTTTNFGRQNRMNILSQEFIREFKSIQGVYSAEIGRASSGGINVITRSGTNEFHGSLFEFVRNDVFDARNFFARGKDKLRLNQFGATVGGPIIKEKLFFFAGWEAGRERRGQQVTGIVPTPLLREKMVAANSAYKPLVDLLPLPTESLPGDIHRGFHRRSDVKRGREDVFMGRFDYAPTQKDNLFLRYTIFDATVVFPNLMPQNGFTFPSQDNNGTISWTHVLGVRAINELRLGGNKQDLPRTFAAYAPGGVGTLTGYLNTPDLEFLRANGGSYTILDNFSYSAGKHSLKTGFEIQWYHYGRSGHQNPIYRMDTLEDILASAPQDVNANLDLNPVLTRTETTRVGIYIQDDFRVRGNLTLNLGLRWEHYTPVKERNGLAFNVVDSPFGLYRDPDEPIWEADYNNFGPRFGLAWDINGDSKNIVRMGGGVFYSDEPHRQVSVLVKDLKNPNQVVLDRNDFPGLRYPIDIRSVDPSIFELPLSRLLENPHHRTTYSEQWSLDYQRQIVTDLALSIGYVGNRGLNLQQLQFLNQFGSSGQPWSGSSARKLGVRPFPSIGQIRWITNEGMSTYHSMQVALRKRLSSGLRFDGYYTWGKAIVSGGGSQESINWIQDPDNIRGSRGRTTLSIEHMVSVNYGWDIPFDKWTGGGKTARLLLGGWSINGITSLRSGFPLNIESGRDNFGSGVASGQRPNLVSGQDIRGGTDNYRTATRHVYVNRAAFTPNTRGLYGNLGAYVLTGPGSHVWDFSIFKAQQLKENVRLQFRTEFFNLFNHTNFNNPNTNLNSGNFGVITGAAPSREIQFGLKLLF